MFDNAWRYSAGYFEYETTLAFRFSNCLEQPQNRRRTREKMPPRNPRKRKRVQTPQKVSQRSRRKMLPSRLNRRFVPIRLFWPYRCLFPSFAKTGYRMTLPIQLMRPSRGIMRQRDRLRTKELTARVSLLMIDKPSLPTMKTKSLRRVLSHLLLMLQDLKTDSKLLYVIEIHYALKWRTCGSPWRKYSPSTG